MFFDCVWPLVVEPGVQIASSFSSQGFLSSNLIFYRCLQSSCRSVEGQTIIQMMIIVSYQNQLMPPPDPGYSLMLFCPPMDTSCGDVRKRVFMLLLLLLPSRSCFTSFQAIFLPIVLFTVVDDDNQKLSGGNKGFPTLRFARISSWRWCSKKESVVTFWLQLLMVPRDHMGCVHLTSTRPVVKTWCTHSKSSRGHEAWKRREVNNFWGQMFQSFVSIRWTRAVLTKLKMASSGIMMIRRFTTRIPAPSPVGIDTIHTFCSSTDPSSHTFRGGRERDGREILTRFRAVSSRVFLLSDVLSLPPFPSLLSLYPHRLRAWSACEHVSHLSIDWLKCISLIIIISHIRTGENIRWGKSCGWQKWSKELKNCSDSFSSPNSTWSSPFCHHSVIITFWNILNPRETEVTTKRLNTKGSRLISNDHVSWLLNPTPNPNRKSTQMSWVSGTDFRSIHPKIRTWKWTSYLLARKWVLLLCPHYHYPSSHDTMTLLLLLLPF